MLPAISWPCVLYLNAMCDIVAKTYVANEGLVLHIGGDYSLRLKCYVTCVTFLWFIILLASNSVSYIVGRDGLA